MFLFINKFSKGLLSILLLIFAYHYFLLGTTNISNLINIPIEKKVIIPIESLDTEKEIVVNEKDDINKSTEKIKGVDEIIIDQSVIIEEPQQKIDTEIITIKVKKGDTFSSILNKQKINKKYIQKIINTTQKIFNLKKLRTDQEITFYYQHDDLQKIFLEKIIIPLTFKEEIVIKKIEEKFVAKITVLPINFEKKLMNVNINKSLFESGNKADMPTSILMDLIRLYSFDVDFQRDIRKEDSYTVLYEIFYNDQRREVAYGDIVYANLILQGKEIEYFLFETIDGFDYFNRQGKNVRKALMKTPLDGARLSSGFGVRKHPILGYDLMHRGVDFAAPRGTPVFAAGNGTVEYVGLNGSYGKYVRIRHNNAYKTAYAHLNGYNKGINTGVRVKQGEIIGYVGTTGRSTGPHLHYEVMLSGKKINPMKMKLPSGKTLKGSELETFIKYSSGIYSEVLQKINFDYE